MNNQEQFAEFLYCCREQRVKRIHLAEPCLIVNSSAGDFGSILIEFEQSNYFITSKYLPHQLEDEEIDEFCVKQYERLADLKNDDLLEADIYTRPCPARTPPFRFSQKWWTPRASSMGWSGHMEPIICSFWSPAPSL